VVVSAQTISAALKQLADYARKRLTFTLKNELQAEAQFFR
jgi:hypothetical protein